MKKLLIALLVPLVALADDKPLPKLTPTIAPSPTPPVTLANASKEQLGYAAYVNMKRIQQLQMELQAIEQRLRELEAQR